MKKLVKIILISVALCAVLGLTVFASAEPMDAASGEPVAEASSEMSIESVRMDGVREKLSANQFDVSFLVNGEEYETACVEYTVEENVYTFRLGELLDVLGLELSYDEESRVVSVSGRGDGLTQFLPSLTEKIPAEETEEYESYPDLTELTPAQARNMPTSAFFRKK